MILNYLKKYWLCVITIIFVIGIAFYLTTCNPQSQNETVYIHDTTVKTRYELAVKYDTIVKWYERVTIKEVKADTVRYQKVDSVFIAQQDGKDLMLGIEKKGTDLRVFALNKRKQLLKEELFTGVYRDFTAYSVEDKIVVKTNVWSYTGIRIYGEAYLPVQKTFRKDGLKNIHYKFGLETGFSFKEVIELNAGIEHDFKTQENQFKINLKTKLY